MRRLLLIAALLVPAVAVAQPSLSKPEAKQMLEEGLAAFEAGDYPAAIEKFKSAYELEPAPVLLYAWAQAERLGGDCEAAVELYRRYLETNPKKVKAEAARAAMALCPEPTEDRPGPDPAETESPEGDPEGDPEGGPAEVAVTTPEPAPPVTTPIAPTRSADSAWYKDPLGDALAIGGVVAIGTGVGFYLLAEDSRSKAEAAELRPDFERLLDEATTRRRIAVVAAGLGAALVTAGILRFVLRDTGESSVSVAATPRGVIISGVL